MSTVDIISSGPESTTVPSGENWVVSVGYGKLPTVNGNEITDYQDSNGDEAGHTGLDGKVVLVEGDTIDGFGHIGGRTVDDSQNPFNKQISSGNTVTVPSDEIWIVWVFLPDGSLSVDGTQIYRTDNDTTAAYGNTGSAKMVFQDGQTITPSGASAFLCGFKRSISSSDLRPRSMLLKSGDDAEGEGESVPSGERWKVWFSGYCDSNDAGEATLYIDESTAWVGSRGGAIGSSGGHGTILSSGRTLRAGQYGNSGDIYVSGFDVS